MAQVPRLKHGDHTVTGTLVLVKFTKGFDVILFPILLILVWQPGIALLFQCIRVGNPVWRGEAVKG